LKMTLLLQIILSFSILGATLGLRFSHVPITVESDVILVNKPTELTCNYVKFRTETVREINWFISYQGFSAKVFTYHVSTGKKVNSIYSHIKTMEDTATESKLTIRLPEFRGNPINVKCEVEVLRDNGYGKLSSSKKEAEVPITVVDSTNHQMSVKKGAWSESNQGQMSQYQASLNEALVVSCASMNVNPSPNLTLTLNGRPWEETSATARIQDASPNSGYSSSSTESSTKVIEGRIEEVYDNMFTSGVLDIECKASYDDFLFDKKQLRLTKNAGTSSGQYVRNRNNNNQYSNQNSNRNSGSYGNSPQRPGAHSSPSVQRPHGTIERDGYGSDAIHSRLLDLLDPQKHMHPGVPYDFYSGYILMVAKNVDTDEEENQVNTGSYYGSRGNQQAQTATTHLFGKLPDEVTSDLQRNYGRFQKISDEKFKITMNPVDVLNLLGNHGFRVIGFTAEADQKMVWTLEQKDFENKIMTSGTQSHRHN